MKKKLLEMAAELLNMANETKMEEIENQGATLYISSNENKAPQVEAEELVELMVGNHEIMFLRVTPDGNKLYSIKYSTQN